MKKTTFQLQPLTYVSLCLVFFSCTNPKEELIKEFIETSGNVRTEMNIKIKHLEQVGWITGKDSLALIQEEIKAQKTQIYDRQLSTINRSSKYLESMRRSGISPEIEKAQRDCDAEIKQVNEKIDKGWQGITPTLDSLLIRQALYEGMNANPLSPIYQCKYSFNHKGEKGTVTAKFAFNKDESKVLAQF